MSFYHKLGDMPRKKHITFPKPDGTLFKEELVSTQGFSSIYSNKYHYWEPSKTLSIKELAPKENKEWKDASPLENMHFYTDKLVKEGDFFTSRIEYMHNPNTQVYFGRPNKNPDFFYKNSYAHEYVFVHRGSGVLKSEYGNLRFEPWDQIIVPMGTTYQMFFDDLSDNKIMVVESDTAFTIPRHYRNEFGQLEEHAPYEERDFKFPDELDPKDELGEFRLIHKAGNRFFEYIMPHHPFDVVGWDGYLFPYKLNMKDYNPKTGRIHLPPPIHLAFVTKSSVLCNFNPRYFDWHEQAIPAPYYHSNVESTEILYYVHGDFMSRTGVDIGSVTMHPLGIPHGPQPGKYDGSVGKKWTDEYAVMLDTFGPLLPTINVKDCQDLNYWKSWVQ